MDKEEENVPEQCRCIRMNELDDDPEGDQFDFHYCWQTRPPAHGPGAGFFECVQYDQFPLRRRACGFWLPGSNHANHAADRVRVMFCDAIRLATELYGWQGEAKRFV